MCLAIGLHQPLFVMQVGDIEAGSYAAAAGLKQGQIIGSINGGSLEDIDPRIQFDLDRASVLKVTPKALGGVEHPLIEAGGWGPKIQPSYKPQWLVLRRR